MSLYQEISANYPLFDPTNWVPPSCRPRITSGGWKYRNIRLHKSSGKFVYDLKPPTQKEADRMDMPYAWSGPYTGRYLSDLMKLEEDKP